MDQKLRVAVIGVGFMGSMHARLYASMPDVALIAVADPVQARAEQVAAQTGCRPYADYQELLTRERPDAVSICTLETQHVEPAVACAQGGVHMFIEKPLASTLDGADRIIRAAADHRVKVGVGYLLRFDPRYSAVKERLQSGELGDVIHIHARRNSPRTEGPRRYGSQLELPLHVSVHDLDLILWYLEGRRPLSLYAAASRKALADLGIDDTVMAVVTFEGGTVVGVESSWALPPASATKLDARFELLGTRGMAEVDVSDTGLHLVTEAGTQLPDMVHWPAVRGRIVGPVREELVDFVAAIHAGRDPLVTPQQARESLRLALAMIASTRSGEVVRLG